jgi:hypothetical protein
MAMPAARRSQAQWWMDLLNEPFHAKAWHGPTLRGALRGVTAEQAVWRPAPGRHNIQEIVAHAAYWKFAVRRRLLKDRGLSFGERGNNWFARPLANEAAWKADIARLDREHAALLETVANLSDARLADPKSIRMIRGIAIHDAYHAGQIKLLVKLTG